MDRLPTLEESRELGQLIHEAIQQDAAEGGSLLLRAVSLPPLYHADAKLAVSHQIRAGIAAYFHECLDSEQLFVTSQRLVNSLITSRQTIQTALNVSSSQTQRWESVPASELMELRRLRTAMTVQSLLSEQTESLLPQGRSNLVFGGANLLLTEEALDADLSTLETRLERIAGIPMAVRDSLRQAFGMIVEIHPHSSAVIGPATVAARTQKPLRYVTKTLGGGYRLPPAPKPSKPAPAPVLSPERRGSDGEIWPHVQVRVNDYRSAAEFYDPEWKEKIRARRAKRAQQKSAHNVGAHLRQIRKSLP